MDWGPLRPPNSKASRKSCQSALSLSQSVEVAHVQGTWSDTTQKTHNNNTGEPRKVSERSHFGVCALFDLSKSRKYKLCCHRSKRSSGIIQRRPVAMCLHTHCCFPMGGTECPLQAEDLHLPANPTSYQAMSKHTRAHTQALVALSQINPQIQADNLKEYLEINANGI